MTGSSGATLRCCMLFHWFDHPLIEGWTEARLWAELDGQHPTTTKNRGLERLEVPVIEALPDVAREAIEREPKSRTHRDRLATSRARRLSRKALLLALFRLATVHR